MTTFVRLARADWGFRVKEGRNPSPERLLDPYGVLHHVGGSAFMGNDPYAAFRLLNDIAHGKGHWGVDYDCLGLYDFANDIGYLGQGNWGDRSAATLDLNEAAEAMCLCGNYQEREPHPAEIELAARGFAWMIEDGLIRPDGYSLIGHRDNPEHPGATQCPGKFLLPHMPTIRRRVAELLAPPQGDDDMTKRYLARLNTNPYHLRVRCGGTADVLRSREYSYVVDHFGEASCPTFYNPMTDEPIAQLADVPKMSETQLDLWIGYESGAALKDEG